MWVEAALAGGSVILFAVTMVWPNWFEIMTDASPDGGDGSLERWFALVWVSSAVGFSLLARRDKRGLADNHA